MANNKQQIKFEADISGFKSAIKEGESSVKSLNKELKLNQEQLKGNKDNVDLLTTRVETLKQQYEEQTKVVEETNSCYEKAVELFGENSEEAKKWADKLTDAKTKQEKIKNALDETNTELKTQSSELLEVGKEWTESGEKITKVGEKIEKVGNKLSIVSAGVAAGVVATVKSAIDYESAFAGVEKTVDGTTEQLQELSDGILEMSTRMPAAATEIAGVAESAGQLGIKTEDVLSFTEVMINLGEATNLSADEAASSLAKFANITNMSADNYEKLGSVIVDLGNNFATTEADIVAMGTNLAATGELTGLTQPQIMALATAMSSVGIEAEAGGSAMSKLLKKIQVACETGGEDLKDFASVANMSSQEFKQAFEKDAVGALSSFLGGLQDTERNGKSAIGVLEDMGLTEVRLSNTILSLSNASGLLSDAVETANLAWDENTALQTEVDKRYSTTESQMEMLKNEVTKLAIEFGNELVPYLRDLLQDAKPLLTTISDAIKKFASLDDKTKQNTIKIIALTVAIGPLVKTVGSLISGVGNALTTIGKLTTKLGEATKGTSSLNSSTGTLSASMGYAGIAIGLATAAIAAHKYAMNKIETATKEAASSTLDLASAIDEEYQSRQSLNESLQSSLNSNMTELDICQKLKNELDTLVDSNGKVKEGYENRASYIVNELSSVLGIEISLQDGVIQKYEELSSTIDKTIEKQKASAYFDVITQKYKDAISSMEEHSKSLEEANSNLAKEQSVLKEKQEQYNKAVELSEKVYGKLGGKYTALVEEAKKAVDEQQNIVDTAQEAANKAQELRNQDLQGQADYDYYTNLYSQGTSEAYEQMCNDIVYNTEGMSKDSVEYVQKMIDESSKQLDWYTNKFDETGKEMYQTQIDNNQKILEEQGKTLLSLTSTTEQMTPEQVNAWKSLASSSVTAYAKTLNELSPETIYKIQEATDRVVSDEQLEQAFKDLGNDSIVAFKKNDFEQAGQDAATQIRDGAEKNKNIFSILGSTLGTSLIKSFKSSSSGITSLASNGSHADGLAYVPYNGYIARLHEGERILTKKENADYVQNNGNGRSNNITVNFYPQQMTEAEIDRASRYINRKWGAMA